MFDSPIGRAVKLLIGLAIGAGVRVVVWQVLWQDLVGTDRETLAAVSATNLVKRDDAPTIRFHDLRPTSATLLLAEGAHRTIVQEPLGHANIAM